MSQQSHMLAYWGEGVITIALIYDAPYLFVFLSRTIKLGGGVKRFRNVNSVSDRGV